MAIDLPSLPLPDIIETVDFEAVLERQKARFSDDWRAVRLANPDLSLPAYDVQMLETDSPVIIAQAESYREVLLRARINDVARSRLLAFSTGSAIDHLAGFYDVVRMIGETDDRLKHRTILAIQGRSTGGTSARYSLIAMSADIRVDDVIVYTTGRSPVIHVAIFSTDIDGVASPDLVATVQAALDDPAVTMVNDTIVVGTAVRNIIDIAASVWLLPDTNMSVITSMADALRLAWLIERSLGRDLSLSWWTSRLMISGVHRVVPASPLGDIVAPPNAAISIGAINLVFAGRDY